MDELGRVAGGDNETLRPVKRIEGRFEEFSEEELERYVLEHADRAIEEGWIRPLYQAIVRSPTGYLCGEEAFARWVDPEFGTLTSDCFVPILEAEEIQHKLDMYMVGCVLDDIKTKFECGVAVVPVSVNISLRGNGEADVATEIIRRVDESGLAHDLLRIEFAESAASNDPAYLESQVTTLKNAGFGVWLDDFGSGRSSLKDLLEYRFDLIKIDMGSVSSIESARTRTIISGIVQVATKLGVGTLAEGVETEDQALFLESVGCSMLQGFFYGPPKSLEEVVEITRKGAGRTRELSEEFDYWNTISSVDLADPTANIEKRAADGSPLTEFPAGIMEHRGATWNVVRANRAYREFLHRGGAVPIELSNLEVNNIARGADMEYIIAAEKSKATGMWERVAGRMEHGTGLQVYTRIAATSPEAEAFLLASVPTMLGTALGTYGDVPVAYAVLRAVLNESGDAVADAEYIFANTVYCTVCDYESESLGGSSFLELTGKESYQWFPYFYRAAIDKETVHDVIYSPELDHWLSFNVSPSPIENCFIYAFTIADDERRERDKIIADRNTSDIIIGITNTFDLEADFESAMNKALEMISQSVHPDRLYIFERNGERISSTFEWCDEGVEPHIEILQDMRYSKFATWEKYLEHDTVVFIPDISELKTVDDNLYRRLKEQGIHCMLAAPLYDGATISGYIVADNYNLEQSLDIRRLLETVSSFISVRIASNKLVNELEDAGTHDGLTGLLNRRGVDIAISERFEERPGEKYVLALMDVDDFKTVNDQYGHAVGDEVLRSLARAFEEALGDDSIIGRNGGDEFIAMLFGDDTSRADELLSSIVKRYKGCEYDGSWYDTSISIGYVCYPEQVKDLQGAYAKADVALYGVKLSGKAGCMRYDPAIESQYRSLLGFSSRDLAENIPGGIMVHKALGKREILFANEEMIRLLGCDSLSDFMEFTGGAFDGLALPEDLERVRAALEHQVECGESEKRDFTEYRIHTKSGSVRKVLANSRLVDAKDADKAFYVIFIDRGLQEDTA